MFGRSSVLLLFGAALLLTSETYGQDPVLREQLFARADRAMSAANEGQANLLAPISYERAARFYRNAESALARGRRIDGIREDLSESVSAFEAAAAAANVARITLGQAFAAREDAMAAEAQTYATRQWREAEETFSSAARSLEDATLSRARRLGDEAEEQFRAAELTAIETNYLSSARMRIEAADDQNVERYAPRTLARAQSLLAEAEASLRRDRYDTDYPRTLAREANYEARHATYLAQRIRSMLNRDATAEDLLLEAEAPLAALASELEIVAEFDEGYDASSTAMLAAIDELRAAQEALRQRDEQVVFLENELASLEAQLGDESEQRKLQEQIQARFTQVASVFSDEEAQVLRRGNDVIVRMGLNFDVGSAVVKSEYFPLLEKIQAAIDVFPGSTVEVQGHTDAFGADESNMELSERRAQAVQQYLLANVQVRAVTIEAVGYGETVPLANNETAAGRLRNRRIDLLIRPDLDTLIAEIGND